MLLLGFIERCGKDFSNVNHCLASYCRLCSKNFIFSFAIIFLLNFTFTLAIIFD